MNPIIRNILAVIIGFVVGSIVNSVLVNIGPSIIPLPEGADVSTLESLAKSMPLFSPANFLFPFLGHAVGTVVAAFLAAKIAASHKMKFAIGLGCLFFLGGIAAAIMLRAPMWFTAVDLVLAYIPMGYLGGKLAGGGNDN